MAGLVSCSAATFGRADGEPSSPTPARPHSYIVEADSTDNAARAVKAAGGEVVSRLGVIDAVEATLTELAARRPCSPSRASSRSPPNAPVTTLAAANVRDNFETGSFANNDGSHRWYGDWVEQNDNNSPYDGKVIDRLARARRQTHDHRRQRRHLSPRRHAVESPAASR